MRQPLESYLSTSEWHIAKSGWDPTQQGVEESQFTLGNGYLGSRGVLEELPRDSRAGTFFAGLYDNTGSHVTELINAPNPFLLQVAIGGEKLDVSAMEVLDHSRALDMRHGAIFRNTLYQTTRERNKIQYKSLRFISMFNPHVVVMRVELTPLDASTVFTVRSGIDTSVTNMGLVTEGAKRHFHIHEYTTLDNTNYLCMKTFEKEILLGYASHLTVYHNGRLRHQLRPIFTLKVGAGRTVVITKYFALFTSQTVPQSAVRSRALDVLNRSVLAGFDELFKRHSRRWEKIWQRSDIQIKGDFRLQRKLRFSIYHLLIAATEHTKNDISIGARCLTGEGYRGHIFWDTEIFMLPFYIYTAPNLAKKLLLYRYGGLAAARVQAASEGYSGAMFPWESAGTGEDVTPTWHKDFDGRVIEIHTGERQHHITADIAYGISHYYHATDDKRFMLDHGLEMLLETARFWASRVEYDSNRRKYSINNVIGPDEFHDNVNDNAYTNAMARENLRVARTLYLTFKRSDPKEVRTLTKRLKFRQKELKTWQAIEEGINIPNHKDGSLIEQFDGYFKRRKYPMPDLDGNSLPRFPSNVRLERIGKTQFVKQADVLMLLYLLRGMLKNEAVARNFLHYEKRTLHKSSLSTTVHACMASRLGLRDMAYRYLAITASIDLNNVYGNTPDGVHAAALGGTWQVVVMGFCGVFLRDGILCFDPHLPRQWQAVSFKLYWHGDRFDVTVDKRQVLLRCRRETDRVRGDKRIVTVQVYGRKQQLELDRLYRLPRGKRSRTRVDVEDIF